MHYKFVTNLSEKEYDDFLKTNSFISYKNESNWSKVNNADGIIYVGVIHRKKLIASSKIEIHKNKKDIYFYIPGGFNINYDNFELVEFLNENIKLLAKERNAYVIKMDVISNIENSLFNKLDYKLISMNKYFEIIDLKENDKFLTQKFFEKSLNLPDIKNSGIFFEIFSTKKQLKELHNAFDYWRYNPHFNYEELLKVYKKKIVIMVEKIDLVFYLNTLRDNCAKESDIVMVDELIKICGDELILGFKLLLLSSNKENIFCIEEKDNGAFPKLNITNQLKFETIKYAINKKYKRLFLPNESKNKCIEFKYHLPINKFKYFTKKIIK